MHDDRLRLGDPWIWTQQPPVVGTRHICTVVASTMAKELHTIHHRERLSIAGGLESI